MQGYQYPIQRPIQKPNSNLGIILAFVVVIIIVILVGSIAIIAMFNAPKSGNRLSLGELTKKDDQNETEDDDETPNKDICVAFAGSDGMNRNQLFFNRLCNSADSEMIRSGWTPEFKFKAYSNQVPDTRQYCIGYTSGPNRSMIVQADDCSNFYNSGWQKQGTFYAYDTEQPDMDQYCVKTANTPAYRMQMWKNMKPCNDNGNGWTPAFQFWLPKS